MPKYLSSTNLITDLAFKSKVGVKSEASVEALAVINQENEEHDLKIESEARNDLKIIAKLFLKTFDVATAKEAINSLKIALGKSFFEKVSNL